MFSPFKRPTMWTKSRKRKQVTLRILLWWQHQKWVKNSNLAAGKSCDGNFFVAATPRRPPPLLCMAILFSPSYLAPAWWRWVFNSLQFPAGCWRVAWWRVNLCSSHGEEGAIRSLSGWQGICGDGKRGSPCMCRGVWWKAAPALVLWFRSQVTTAGIISLCP